MLLKIYTTSAREELSPATESVTILDNVKDVTVHQGNWGLPPYNNSPTRDYTGYGPQPFWDKVTEYLNNNQGSTDGHTVRIVDYTRDGQQHRALVGQLCYVCNDQGKTIEKVELYSGARLSVA